MPIKPQSLCCAGIHVDLYSDQPTLHTLLGSRVHTAVKTHQNLIKMLLPTALYLLLSVAMLPNSYNHFSSKAITPDPGFSLPGLQAEAKGTADGENQDFHIAAIDSDIVPTTVDVVPLRHSASTKNIDYTLSQARAPPIV